MFSPWISASVAVNQRLKAKGIRTAIFVDANPEVMAMLGRGVTGAAPSVVGRLTPPTFTVQQSKIGLGTLGTTGNCITNVGCIRSEMLIVERRAPDKLRFVVVWQNMKDPKPQSDPGSERWRLRDLIQKTIDGYVP